MKTPCNVIGIVIVVVINIYVSSSAPHSGLGFHSHPNDNGKISTEVVEIKRLKANCRSVQNSAEHCPYVIGYLSNNSKMRSTSPWIMITDVDPKRSPQSYNVACCVCIHCVNMTTSVPQIMPDHFSEIVEAKFEISYGGKHKKFQTRSVGCTCVYRPHD